VGRDGPAGFAGDNYAEDFWCVGEVREKHALGIRGTRFCGGEMPQYVEDDFVGFDELSFKAGSAKLQDGVAFVEVPGQGGAHCYRALEAGVSFFGCEACRRVRIQNEYDAAVILASELAHHQRTKARRRFPVHVTRAVAWLIVP